MDDFEQQVKVSKMLGLGFVLSITGIAGIGSFIALILGWKAMRIIKALQGRLTGAFMAWWCICASALGTLIFPPLLIAIVLRQLK